MNQKIGKALFLRSLLSIFAKSGNKHKLSKISGLIVSLLLATYFACHQFQKAEYRIINSDEATTVLASQGVLKTGVPTLPSGLIYYRSPVSHYLNALSIASLGDKPIGWSGASIISYWLLLLTINVYLTSSSRPWLGVFVVILIGLNPLIVEAAASPRMYMVYTFFATLTNIWLLSKRPPRFNRAGWVYLAFALIAAFSHEHFILMTPGLFVGGLMLYFMGGQKLDRSIIKSPLFMVPICGSLAALLIHFADVHLPYSWANMASNPTSLGRNANLAYPIETLFENSVMQPYLVIVLAWLFSLSKVKLSRELVFLLIASIFAILGIGVTLPHLLPKYVTPIVPVFILTLTGFGLGHSSFGVKRIQWISLMLILGLVFLGHSKISKFTTVQTALAIQKQVNSPEMIIKWNNVREFIQENGALVLSSDPEVVYLRTRLRVDYEPRTLGVRAPSECEYAYDDQFGHPYIHSMCILQKVLIENSGRPVIFIGTRLTSVLNGVGQFIRINFRRLPSIGRQEAYCLDQNNFTKDDFRKLDASIIRDGFDPLHETGFGEMGNWMVAKEASIIIPNLEKEKNYTLNIRLGSLITNSIQLTVEEHRKNFEIYRGVNDLFFPFQATCNRTKIMIVVDHLVKAIDYNPTDHRDLGIFLFGTDVQVKKR